MTTTPESKKTVLSEVSEIRRRAKEHVECGAVTPSYQGDLETTLRLLNEALATEWVCTLRYKNHYYMADGLQAKAVAEEFLQHANEEQTHADQLAVRIRQLGGSPELNPVHLAERSHAEYQESDTLVGMIKQDLIAERIAIESYREMVEYFKEYDPTSRRLLEEILAKEEEHAEDMSSLLMTLDPTKSATRVA